MTDNDWSELDAPCPLSDSDVSSYRQFGWLKVSNAVSSEVALTLRDAFLDVAAQHQPKAESLDPNQTNHANSEEINRQHVLYNDIDRWIDVFRQTVLSRRLGSIAGQLLGCDPVQHFRSSIFAKDPEVAGGTATSLHQDYPYEPFDRSRSLTIWLALMDLVPEMGTLRFVDGSHRFGVLGRDELYRPDHDYVQHLQQTEGWKLSKPAELGAGDATVHADLTLHGADSNLGDGPRIALSVIYFDPATLYTGAPSSHVDGFKLQSNAVFDPKCFELVECAP
jgi:ectoine hydroxylase-related dioxygenase (phytanoyl-CoA dioxygenase family)